MVSRVSAGQSIDQKAFWIFQDPARAPEIPILGQNLVGGFNPSQKYYPLEV